MKCHYEVLGVEKKATDEDIKKSYRKLALVWHPDKNPDRIQECTEYFAVIQQAYDVLSDPHERAWYDRHRDQILKGGITGDFVDKSVNLFPYFSGSCYHGFDDSDRGFYTVYRQLFELLAREDLEYISDDSDRQIPGFGQSTSDYDTVVHPFYAYWQSYSTAKSYVWLEKYDIRQADNRRVLRLMEKENKKIRETAKKERNEEVRELIRFVRKRDRRVEVNRQLLQQKRIERETQVQLERDKQRREQLEKMTDYKETDWSAKETHDKELRIIENLLKAEFGSDQSSSDESESDLEEALAESINPLESIDLSAQLADELFCVACEKSFKTRNAYDNHEKSKKHRENVAELKKQMAADELAMLNLVDKEEKPEINIATGGRKPKNKKRQKKKKLLATSNCADSDGSSEAEEVEAEKPILPEAEESATLTEIKTEIVHTDNAVKGEVKPKDRREAEGEEKCAICGIGFASRNKLFAHIKATGHAQLKDMPEETTRKNKKKKK